MYLPRATTETILKAIPRLPLRPGEALFIWLAEKNLPPIPPLIEALNREGIDFAGGIFPEVIHGDKKFGEGAVIFALPVRRKPLLFKDLSRKELSYPDLSAYSRNGVTALIMLDGRAPRISSFLSGLYRGLGGSVHYFGAGAGFYDLMRRPCVLTPEGIFAEAAVVAFVALPSILGVRHGWTKIAGPLVANKTRNNVIAELNWKNAFTVYRSVVESHARREFEDDDFYSLSLNYPFGIYKEGAEDVVREVVSVDPRGELTCGGDIPENTVLNILTARKEDLIVAARRAARECALPSGLQPRRCLIAECVSRSLFLGKEMSRELAVIRQNTPCPGDKFPPEGILSLGEISSGGEGYLDFYNKTLVIAELYEPKS